MLVISGDVVELKEETFKATGVSMNEFLVVKVVEDRCFVMVDGNKKYDIKVSSISRIIRKKKIFLMTYGWLDDLLRGLINRDHGSIDVRSIEKNSLSIVGEKIAYVPLSRTKNDYFYIDRSGDSRCVQYGKPIPIINSILKLAGRGKLTKEEEHNILSQITADDYYFKEVTGKDITKYYYGEYYLDGGGSLNHSCMRYFDNTNKHNSIFKLYEENASMLVLFAPDGSVAGRAIIWNVRNKYSGEIEFRMMDRVYTQRDMLENLFVKYAEDNGLAHLEAQVRGMHYVLLNKKKKYLDDYKIVLNKELIEYLQFPYLDTWHSASTVRSKELFCCNHKCGSAPVNLTSTRGFICFSNSDEAMELMTTIYKNDGYVFDDDIDDFTNNPHSIAEIYEYSALNNVSCFFRNGEFHIEEDGYYDEEEDDDEWFD